MRPLKELVLPTASLHVIERGATGTDHAAGDSAGGDGRASRGGSEKVLSVREREIARMLADGQSCPEIAQSLALSVNTVRTVTKRLYAKIGVRRRAELANWLRSP